MNIIDIDDIRPFDVDGTLIVDKDKSTDIVRVYDPLTKKNITFGINKAMVRLLKEEHHRGNAVIVWSRSGYEWAKNVVIALGLEKYVNTVMSKPLVYFDDMPVKKWLKDRVFIGPEVKYKE